MTNHLHDAADRHDRLEAALVKILKWKGYAPQPEWYGSDLPFTEFEIGANDMLATLQAIAAEGLGVAPPETEAEEVARLKREEAEYAEQEYLDAQEDVRGLPYDPA